MNKKVFSLCLGAVLLLLASCEVILLKRLMVWSLQVKACLVMCLTFVWIS